MTRLAMALATSAAIVLAGGAAAAAEAPKLPKSMVWTAYDLGSSGYAEAAGIANAFQKNFDVRVRIIPSGTSIGRLLPVTTGKATYGFLASGAYFASQGTYDFAAPEWGPQDIRIVAGKPATSAFAVAGDIGVKTIADLKGKRIGFVKGNPSVNVKTEGYLAFGDLTMKDVQPVWFGSYNAMKTAVISGQLDAFISTTISANMREIEASPRGLVWPEYPPDNKQGWDAIQKIISFAAPRLETTGAGVSEANPKQLIGFRYPMVTTYARTSDEDAYNMIKAMDLTYDDYKHTAASSHDWAIEKSGHPPYDAPTHPGAIRYMQEKGLWTAEDQAWNDRRLAEMNRTLAAWDEARAEFDDMRAAAKAKGETVDDGQWPEFWDSRRVAAIN
ncbi:MAG: TAXI family TRAP transporter solute-binding subunit [Alphaproteobacteria bacterium]